MLAPAAAPSGTALYYHPDHLGSTSFMTNREGKIVSETHYYPFGLPHLQTGSDPGGTRYLHTDHELDPESGLIYSNARYRDPVVGRFVSVDPFFGDPSVLEKETVQRFLLNPQEGNIYAYALNNLVKWIDPTGLWTFQFGFSGTAGAGGGVTAGGGLVIGYSEENGFQIGSMGLLVQGGFGGGQCIYRS